MEKPTIRRMTEQDWEEVRNIYYEGILTGKATLETAPPTKDQFFKKHVLACSLVACINRRTAGWVSLSHVSNREAYRGVGELSVYVSSNYHGYGIGKQLMLALIKASEEQGFWTLQASIFRENHQSLALHRRCGFREVGVREKIGKLGEKWHDIVIMERRSDKIF